MHKAGDNWYHFLYCMYRHNKSFVPYRLQSASTNARMAGMVFLLGNNKGNDHLPGILRRMRMPSPAWAAAFR